MATYKVIQDIEAEDKLLGPFGLRQFIYLIIVAVSLFVGYKLMTVSPLMILPLLPHTLFFALLALPIGGEQPTETWLLAKIRYFLKPRRRVWDQSGQLNLVTITAPKRIEKVLTKNMSQTEVRSRLQALANTIDSRGWAVKNVNVNMFSQPTFAMAGSSTDRLIDAPAVAQPTPYVTASDDMMDEQNNPTAQNLDRMISASTKAYKEKVISNMRQPDPTSVPIIKDSNLHPFRNVTYTKTDTGDDAGSSIALPDPTRDDSTPAPDYWFMNDTPAPPRKGEATFESSVVSPDPNAVARKSEPKAPSSKQTSSLTEEELLEKIHEEKKKQPHSYGNLRVIKPIEEQRREAEEALKRAAKEAEELAKVRAQNEASDLGPFDTPSTTPSPFTPTFASPLDDPINSGIPFDDTSVTQSVDPDIIELANNDDLNVETIARQAKKNKEKDLPDDGEVVINLH